MQIPYRKPTQFSNLIPDPHITQEKFNELTRKLERLITITRPQAAAEVSRLAELGDFSENAEYQLAKGRLRGINSSILKIQHHLNNAIIFTPQSSDRVQLGSRVTVTDGEQQKTFQIVGSSEINILKGIISHHSPIGAALMDHMVGETVIIKLAHKKITYTILTIA
jgi:transcription elongation factor GreA